MSAFFGTWLVIGIIAIGAKFLLAIADKWIEEERNNNENK